MSLKIIIPSKNKASSVIAHKLVEGGTLCVPESQVSDYQRYNSNVEIIGYPDSIETFATRNKWILDKFNHVFFISDNIINCLKLCGVKSESTKVEPEKVTELIYNADDIATQLGTYLFGFSANCVAASYHGLKPFRSSGSIDGYAFGVRSGSKLFWNDNITEDLNQIWLSGLNAHFHRSTFVDERFGFKKAQTYAHIEGKKTNDSELLKHYFGNAVTQKKDRLEFDSRF